MRSLRARVREEEWMDGPDVTPAEMAACLRDLAQVNTVTLARGPTLAWLARMTRGWRAGQPFTLVDVGAGEGDMLCAIANWARRRDYWAKLTGYDLNARCAEVARAATPDALGIDYVVGDAMAADISPDFIVSALVTHHMDDDGVVAFLRWMERTARRGWFINDLHRNWFAYHGFALLSTVARWHPFVRHDGPLSVARAFRKRDWARLLARAGVTEAKVVWRFPFRLCVERRK
jgi:2-polyprenyl-3-methyl-5-hydroxy-6-metoxy-1,4-benzoquinol methylase